MEKFKIAAVQMNALKDDLDHNIKTHMRFIEETSEAGCHLVMFPELSVTAHYGDEKVMQFIADECNVPVENTVALVAPTASIVGSVQVSGRVVETGIFKLNELGFDTTQIVCGTGTAPIAPVVKDDLKAMGCTNDSVIYYGSIVLTTRGFDEELFKQVPSSTSSDYGKPFFKTFKDAGYDFYKIDANIFAPAEVLVNDLDTGNTYHTGHLNAEVIMESYGISGI